MADREDNSGRNTAQARQAAAGRCRAGCWQGTHRPRLEFAGVAWIEWERPADREALAEAGIASLRYDKRASGPDAAQNMRVLAGTISMESHLEELAGAVRRLADDNLVRRERICALGNSEGTLHILNYQLSGSAIPLAGLILTGPPGRAVAAVARSQLAAAAATLPNGDALLHHYDEALGGSSWAGPGPGPRSARECASARRELVHPANQPFARQLWTANAASLLPQITAPTLIVIGKKGVCRWTGRPTEKRSSSPHRGGTTSRSPFLTTRTTS